MSIIKCKIECRIFIKAKTTVAFMVLYQSCHYCIVTSEMEKGGCSKVENL